MAVGHSRSEQHLPYSTEATKYNKLFECQVKAILTDVCLWAS